MFKRSIVAILVASVSLPSPAIADASATVIKPAPVTPSPKPAVPEKEKDGTEGPSNEQKAALIAALVAASVAAYLAMGKPCACPYNTTRSGRSCGGNSAWSRAGGYKPLCYPTDVTPGMLIDWIKFKKVPTL